MVDAKQLADSWKWIPEYMQKRQAKHMLSNAGEFLIHEVGKLKVFQLNGHVEVINEESLVVKFFDTEEEALNFCLDVYPETKTTKQGELFE